ncbi:MAG: dolichyl-phosphate beta-glucosyltransferase [Dehalococcoidia bacterium]
MASVDVVVPVYNEQEALPRGIPTLHRFLSSDTFSHDWHIVIADNASIDGTPEVSAKLAKELRDVTYVHIPVKGRGHALRETWSKSSMDIVSYMDVDLSTDLIAFPPLIDAVAQGGHDLAVGTRLAHGSDTRRSLQRETLSRGYNLLIKAMFQARFSDAQCGFKAARATVARRLIPLIQDGGWFFDTELLILAEKVGYSIQEIPVRWREEPDTRVRIGETMWEDIRGLLRLRLSRPWRRGKGGERP